MRKSIEYKKIFIMELNRLGVAHGFAEVSDMAERCLRDGIRFCQTTAPLLSLVIRKHIPDHTNYPTLIKGSKTEGAWGLLYDGFDTVRRNDSQSTKVALDALERVLTDFKRSNDMPYERRIIVAIGAALNWKPPVPPDTITPVGKLLQDTRQTIDLPPIAVQTVA